MEEAILNKLIDMDKKIDKQTEEIASNKAENLTAKYSSSSKTPLLFVFQFLYSTTIAI